MSESGCVIVVPTYNEAGNIEAALRGIARLLPEARTLVVDDASPDGTAGIVNKLADAGLRCSLLSRASKLGLGTAYVEGFRQALEMPDVEAVVQMDADGSHAFEDVPRLLAGLQDADLVIGSRYVPGGATPGWSRMRRLLSQIGRIYARTVLRLPTQDVTSGFRAWRVETLRQVLDRRPRARGYGFQIETTVLAKDLRARISEISIQFRERAAGESKMSWRIVREALLLVPVLAVQRWRCGRRTV